MKNLCLFFALAVLSVALLAGCKTKSGDREFIPGRGWVPVSTLESGKSTS
jgi:hypothetical protein